MPNGKNFLNDLELEKYIRYAPDRELLEFVARQSYETCLSVEKNDKRITSLEKRSNKFTGFIGASGTFFGAAIVATINFFMNRG